jgi:hypothetical protein
MPPSRKNLSVFYLQGLVQIGIGIAIAIEPNRSKSTVAPTKWRAMTSVKVAAIPIPIPIAIPMVAQWNPETHDLRIPLSMSKQTNALIN